MGQVSVARAHAFIPSDEERQLPCATSGATRVLCYFPDSESSPSLKPLRVHKPVSEKKKRLHAKSPCNAADRLSSRHTLQQNKHVTNVVMMGEAAAALEKKNDILRDHESKTFEAETKKKKGKPSAYLPPPFPRKEEGVPPQKACSRGETSQNVLSRC